MSLSSIAPVKRLLSDSSLDSSITSCPVSSVVMVIADDVSLETSAPVSKLSMSLTLEPDTVAPVNSIPLTSLRSASMTSSSNSSPLPSSFFFLLPVVLSFVRFVSFPAFFSSSFSSFSSSSSLDSSLNQSNTRVQKSLSTFLRFSLHVPLVSGTFAGFNVMCKQHHIKRIFKLYMKMVRVNRPLK